MSSYSLPKTPSDRLRSLGVGKGVMPFTRSLGTLGIGEFPHRYMREEGNGIKWDRPLHLLQHSLLVSAHKSRPDFSFQTRPIPARPLCATAHSMLRRAF